MGSIKGIYAGKYLVANDLSNDPITYEILGARIDRQYNRVALSFAETGRSLLLNKTNAKHIADTAGDDFDKWAGVKVVIKREPVTYMGDQVDGVRVVGVVLPLANGEHKQ
jgi:hypothetical protein